MKTPLASLTICALAGAAIAHSGATGIVKERMDGMKEMSNATKALGAIKAGAIPYSPEVVKRAAAQLRTHAEAAREQFPDGSAGGASEALPTIFSDRAGFNQLLTDLIDAAVRLDDAAGDEAEAMTAADQVAATCKKCHADYREKKI